MRKNSLFKYIFVFVILILFTTGWTWKDAQKKYENVLNKNISCTYSHNDSKYGIKTIKVDANSNEFAITLDSSRIIIAGNGIDTRTSINIGGADFRLYSTYSNKFESSFTYKILSYYSENNKCIPNLYLVKEVIDSMAIYELRDTQITDSEFEKWNIGSALSSDAKCHINNYYDCYSRYHQDNEKGITHFIEFGYVKTNIGLKKYFLVAGDKAFGDAVSDLDESDGFRVLYNGYLYTIDKDEIDKIWLSDNTISSKIVIGKSYNNTNFKATYYITDENSENPGNKSGGTTGDPSTMTPDSKEIKTNLNYGSICGNEGVQTAFKVLGTVIFIVKILAPLLIIVFGMIDYFNAVTSSDENALSKATESLIKRLVSGIVIFFIPTLLWGILNLLDITDGIHDLNNTEFGACTRCLLKNECK